MDKSNEQPKKCFCARCFLPIDPEDKVDIDGQNFHRSCSTCCVCQTIPKSLKMFYGHVFCAECFKSHVLNRFKGECPYVEQTNSWWMQWGPKIPAQENMAKGEAKEDEAPASPSKCSEDQPKRCICARCLQACDENCKIDIGNQSFHPHCARCCKPHLMAVFHACGGAQSDIPNFCHRIPTNSVKIYYGQVFCEECFNRHVLGKNKDNPAEFYKSCFEQWQNHPQFAEHMNQFMASGNKDQSPVVMMMGAHPPFCRCGNHHQSNEWKAPSETHKSVTKTQPGDSIASFGSESWDHSFDNRTEASADLPKNIESAKDSKVTAASEKIENLTKYLHGNIDNENEEKKWQNASGTDDNVAKTPKQGPPASDISLGMWTDIQDPAVKTCSPKCLWQCGPIYVNRENLQQKEVVCCSEDCP